MDLVEKYLGEMSPRDKQRLMAKKAKHAKSAQGKKFAKKKKRMQHSVGRYGG